MELAVLLRQLLLCSSPNGQKFNYRLICRVVSGDTRRGVNKSRRGDVLGSARQRLFLRAVDAEQPSASGDLSASAFRSDSEGKCSRDVS